MPTLEYAPGARLYYRDMTAGPLPDGAAARPAVVLLHGLGVTGRSWQLQIPALVQAGWRVLAVDLPGFGGSSVWHGAAGAGAPAFAGMGRLSTPVVCLLDALRIERAALVGLSLGGTVALQIALDHPGRVERLMLVNTFARLPWAKAFNLRLWPYYLYRYLLVHSSGLERQARTVGRRLFPRPEDLPQRVSFVAQVLQAGPDDYRASMRLLARFNVEPRLGELPTSLLARTLVVTGTADTMVTPAVQQRLAEALPGAQHRLIPGANHAVIAEQPEAFNKILLEFLKI